VEPRAADLADLTSLSALSHPVRRRLYELVIQAPRAIGRDEAAMSAGVSRSLAAYHLEKLTEQGLLEASFAREGSRAGPGAGRPAKVYRRSRREFILCTPPRDYQLLGELLARAADKDRTGAVRATLEHVAYTYGQTVGESAKQVGRTGATGLSRVLHQRGYEPFEDDGGMLLLQNCPFESVAADCPEVVCELNLRLVEGLIAGLDVRSARAVFDPADERCCVTITSASSGCSEAT
jgi:predicted ArsR family transcriptional regulator